MNGFRCLPSAVADRLRVLSFAARRPMAGSLQGAHRSTRHGASVEFAEFRPYAPGDPPALIDWAAYARSDRWLVRRFEEETDLVGWVLLDISESMAWRSAAPRSKLEHARDLAAAALYVLAAQGDRAGLATFSDAVHQRHAAAGAIANLRPHLEALDAVRPGGRGDLGGALQQCCAFLPRRALVLVVSDLLQEPRPALDGLRRLHHDGHDVRVLHVLDRGELDLPRGGLADVRDLETGERVELDLDESRAAYRAAVEAHLDEIRRGCQAIGAHYRLVDTSEPVEAALRGM